MAAVFAGFSNYNLGKFGGGSEPFRFTHKFHRRVERNTDSYIGNPTDLIIHPYFYVG